MRVPRPDRSGDGPPGRGDRCGPPQGRSQELLAALRDAAGERGWIPFSTYMDLALFHPTAGYYARLSAVGARGDFATSASLSPVFGKLMARQFIQIWQRMGAPSRFDVVELGPGGGQFAAAALEEAARHRRFYRALRYGLMERSPSLRETQATLLARWQDKLHWGSDLEELAPDGIEGLVFSNEFFDALPCHRLEQTADGLCELAVKIAGDRLEEIRVAPSSPRLAAEIAADGLNLREGQRVEVSLAALDVMAALGKALKSGAVITVDYGDVAGEVYGPRRLKGSVRGYFRHMRVEDPFARPGAQDLTYDVNFTALARAGAEAGLRPLGLAPQGEVLRRLGLEAEIRAARRGKSPLEADQASAPIEKLAEPLGMGEGFKVLFQGKGVEPADLAGLGGAPLRESRGRWTGLITRLPGILR